MTPLRSNGPATTLRSLRRWRCLHTAAQEAEPPRWKNPSSSSSSSNGSKKEAPAPPPAEPAIAILTPLSAKNKLLLKDVVSAIENRRYPSVFQHAQKIFSQPIATAVTTNGGLQGASPPETPSSTPTPTPTPDTETYSLLIEACAHFPGCLMQELAFALFAEMKSRNLRPTTLIYHNLLRLLSTSPDYLKRALILREMKDRWFEVTPLGWGWVIRGLLKDHQFELALETFERKLLPLLAPTTTNVNTSQIQQEVWDDLITSLAEKGEVEEAFRLAKMAHDSLSTTLARKTWYSLLTFAARGMYRDATLWAWRHVYVSSIFPPDDGLLEEILLVASRYAIPSLATDVLRVMARRGITFQHHHYAALVEMYLDPSVNEPRKAFAVVRIMMRALGGAGAKSLVKAIVGCVKGNNRVSGLESALRKDLDMLLGRSGSGSASGAGESSTSSSNSTASSKPTKLALNAMAIPITAITSLHARQGHLKQAWDCYNLLAESGITPTADVFNAMLEGCSILPPLAHTLDIGISGNSGSNSGDTSTSTPPPLPLSPYLTLPRAQKQPYLEVAREIDLKRRFAEYLFDELSELEKRATRTSHPPPSSSRNNNNNNNTTPPHLLPRSLSTLTSSSTLNPQTGPDGTTYSLMILVHLNSYLYPLPPPLPSPDSPPPPPSSSTSLSDPLTTALTLLHTLLTHPTRLMRPRQWLLRAMLEAAVLRDDDRVGEILEVCEELYEGLEREREICLGLWKRVEGGGGKGGIGGGRGRWVRCGRRPG